jgi:hypothetical protein
MRLVVIESPLSGDFERNVRYAKWCMLDSLRRGEYPFASHLLYTQCLDDEDPEHRKLGMEAGFEWAQLAEVRAIYRDLGVSGGMMMGIGLGIDMGQEIDDRSLPAEMWEAFLRGEEPNKTKGF